MSLFSTTTPLHCDLQLRRATSLFSAKNNDTVSNMDVRVCRVEESETKAGTILNNTKTTFYVRPSFQGKGEKKWEATQKGTQKSEADTINKTQYKTSRAS